MTARNQTFRQVAHMTLDAAENRRVIFVDVQNMHRYAANARMNAPMQRIAVQ